MLAESFLTDGAAPYPEIFSPPYFSFSPTVLVSMGLCLGVKLAHFLEAFFFWLGYGVPSSEDAIPSSEDAIKACPIVPCVVKYDIQYVRLPLRSSLLSYGCQQQRTTRSPLACSCACWMEPRPNTLALPSVLHVIRAGASRRTPLPSAPFAPT